MYMHFNSLALHLDEKWNEMEENFEIWNEIRKLKTFEFV